MHPRRTNPHPLRLRSLPAPFSPSLLCLQLFRCGGAAVLLSNRPMDGFRAKYKLLHTVRVQDTSDEATKCVFQCEDEAGIRGVELTKELMDTAGKTMRDNFTLLGPQVLPVREQLKFGVNFAARRAVPAINRLAETLKIRIPFTGGSGRLTKPELYRPDFKAGIQVSSVPTSGMASTESRWRELHTAGHRSSALYPAHD